MAASSKAEAHMDVRWRVRVVLADVGQGWSKGDDLGEAELGPLCWGKGNCRVGAELGNENDSQRIAMMRQSPSCKTK